MALERGALIELDGVSKQFRQGGSVVEALSAVDLSIGRGEFVSIIGPSGCGKSTLLRLVAGLLPAPAGQGVGLVPARPHADPAHAQAAYRRLVESEKSLLDVLGNRRFPEDFHARRSPTANLLADVLTLGMDRGEIARDDVWEVALALWAHAHGLICLYRAGRFSLAPEPFRALYHRSLGRMLDGLTA